MLTPGAGPLVPPHGATWYHSDRIRGESRVLGESGVRTGYPDPGCCQHGNHDSGIPGKRFILLPARNSQIRSNTLVLFHEEAKKSG